MRWYTLLALSLLSGLLLASGWYGFPYFMFLAWLPMLRLSDELLAKGGRNAFGRGLIYSYPGFLLWNALTTYWICYTTVPGGIFASVANAFLMSLVFALWHSCRKQVEQRWMHPIMFIALWISFEYLHLNWDLTWPWLNLGNAMSTIPRWVQWYSITGALGGTFWILAINFILYESFYHERTYHTRSKGQLVAFLVWIIPIVISFIVAQHYTGKIDKSQPVKAVVVQPNTEVWTEQYKMSNYQEAERILEVAKPYIDRSTNLVVCPESSIAHSVSLAALQAHEFPAQPFLYGGFNLLDSAIAENPNLNFILGLSTYDIFDHKATVTAQEIDPAHYVDMYNTAVCYNRNHYDGHYHKSRLVPGVEAMPFPKVFGFLSNLLIELGGANTSLAKDSAQRVFTIDVNGKPVKMCTAICYESIYGELVGHFVRNGAQVLTVITNDSWWSDSPGHKQHFDMARLRAVENRRYILRAANGGYSGVIDPVGNVLQKTQYQDRTAFLATIYAQDKLTFYAKYGDIIAWAAIPVAAFGILYSLILCIIGIFKKSKSR